MYVRVLLPYVRIILFSMGCTVLYGIIHAQVAAHVCVEYFIVDHLSLWGLRNPTALGVLWGTIAACGDGLGLGVALALVSRLGPRQPLAVRDIRRPLLLLLLACGLTSFLSGLVGYAMARAGAVYLPYYATPRVPQAQHALFIADSWAEDSASTVGSVGSLLVCVWALWRRGYLQRDGLVSLWGQRAWRLIARTWDRSARPNALARILTILALLVLVLGTYVVCSSWFIAAGDLVPTYFAVGAVWPIVLLIFWAIGTAALFAARQPRAIALFLAFCVVLGVIVTAILFGLASSTGASVGEFLLSLDLAVSYAAWRLLLRPSIVAPP